MFSIDGLVWDIPCDIIRVSEVRASEISGLMLDKSYFNDVLGTYLRYTVKIAVPLNLRDQYTAIYEAITAPVDGHVFVLPYNRDNVTITARVESISDVYVRLQGGGVYWKGIQFDVIANHPTKTMTLGEAVDRGMTPLPPISDPDEGDTYTYSNGEWVPGAEYEDADDIYF